MATRKDHNKFAGERTEALMLMAVLADRNARNEAVAELKRRRGSEYADPLPAGYITNFGIIPG